MDSCVLVPLREGLLDHGVEVSEKCLVPDEHVAFDTDGVHHSGELDGYVAGADEGHLLGKLGNVEEAVASDAVLGARNVLGHCWVPSCCNQDVRSGEGCSPTSIPQLHLELLLPFESRRSVNEIHSLPAPIPLVRVVQIFHIGITLLLEFGKLKGDILWNIVGVMDSILQCFRNRGKIPG